MFVKRSTTGVFAWLATLAVASAAMAQHNWEPSDNKWLPLGPVGFEHEQQAFAKADFSEFGGRDVTTQGVIFVYERLNWHTIQPAKMPLGNDDIVLVTSTDGQGFVNQMNSMDQSVRTAGSSWGNRFDLGYWDGETGWLAGVLRLDQQVNLIEETRVAVNLTNPVSFIGNGDPVTLLSGFVDADNDGVDDDVDGDGVFGRFTVDTDGDGVPDAVGPQVDSDYGDTVVFPTVFDTLVATNRTQIGGVELMKMHRLRPFHNGSVFELFLGARYTELDDHFRVEATGGFVSELYDENDINGDPIVAQSHWDTDVDNRIIGPQVGGRWYVRRGPWNFAVEGRFFAGFNFQSIRQKGAFAENLPVGVNPDPGTPEVIQNSPLALDNRQFEHTARWEEFSPTTELRVETNYQLTRAISLKVGWTGLYSSGIARASNLVVYQLPDLGIDGNNQEEFFTHGVNFGVTYNR